MTQKAVLITGGTGSFGKTMLEDLLSRGCPEVRIFSRDEEKQDLLRTTLRNPNVRYFLGDIRDRESVDRAMAGVDCVFHAAALKQVPSCEFFPLEAVSEAKDLLLSLPQVVAELDAWTGRVRG